VIERVNNVWLDAAASRPELGLPIVSSSEMNSEARYEIFRRTRVLLYGLYAVIKDFPLLVGPAEIVTIMSFGSKEEPLPPPARGELVITGGGVQVKRDAYEKLLRAIEDTGPDIRGLKSCPNCHAVFLQRRANQTTCSSSCGNTMRVRRARKSRAKKLAEVQS